VEVVKRPFNKEEKQEILMILRELGVGRSFCGVGGEGGVGERGDE
jgi:hypothetical protein